MGTRTNISITTEGKYRPEESMMIYRHYDGYPESVMPDLLALVNIHIKNGHLTVTPNRAKQTLDFISSNVTGLLKQAPIQKAGEEIAPRLLGQFQTKISQYEETDNLHGDIEWFYDLDLSPKFASLEVYEVTYPKDEEGKYDWSVPTEDRLKSVAKFVFSPKDTIGNQELIDYIKQEPALYNCGFNRSEVLNQKAEAWRYIPADWWEAIDSSSRCYKLVRHD